VVGGGQWGLHGLRALAGVYTDLAVLPGAEYYLGVGADWSTALGAPALARYARLEQAQTHLLGGNTDAARTVLTALVRDASLLRCVRRGPDRSVGHVRV
jgi:hypothetical protein